MKDKQLIKQEIERIIEEETPIFKGSDYYHGAKESMEKLLQFIDSLPEKSGCEIDFTAKDEDLEEAAKHYLYGAILYDDVYVGNPTEEDCIRCFKAGAEWKQKKDQETIELAEDHAMLAGMMKEREEMMKDAVELTITNTSFIPLPKLDIKAGDKVKIVVLKTE